MSGAWSHHDCAGGIMLERDGDGIALISIWPGRSPAYPTALKHARRMVRLLNAGEACVTQPPSTSDGRNEMVVMSHPCGNGAHQPILPPGDEPSGPVLTEAERACLLAAKQYLLKTRAHASICPGSIEPQWGWGAVSPWSDWRIDWRQGGPWSVEVVADLCQRGLLGVDPKEPTKALRTPLGGKAIRPPRRRASPAEQSVLPRDANT